MDISYAIQFQDATEFAWIYFYPSRSGGFRAWKVANTVAFSNLLLANVSSLASGDQIYLR